MSKSPSWGWTICEFLFFTICDFLTICGFLFCWRYVSFLRHYFVHDIWVRLNHKAWPHLLISPNYVNYVTKTSYLRGDKILLKSSFVPFHQYYPIQSTTYICSFPPMTQEPFGEYILLKAYNFDNDWLIDFAGKSLNRIEFSQENICSFPPTTMILLKAYNDWVHF